MMETGPRRWGAAGVSQGLSTGEIYTGPAVGLRTRSLCTIAALVVLGAQPAE